MKMPGLFAVNSRTALFGKRHQSRYGSDTESCILPDSSYLHPELIVSDIIYNPRKTRLLKMAEEAGCPFFNGLYMLLYQGAAAFSLWTNKEMPIELIKKTYFNV